MSPMRPAVIVADVAKAPEFEPIDLNLSDSRSSGCEEELASQKIDVGKGTDLQLPNRR